MKNTAPIQIEQRKKFSESCLWRLQREYFDRAGIDAWVNQVPFYITSNPYIAECYAQLAVSFIRDTLQQNPSAKKHPFYILELGTGSGRFSFFVLKTLLALCQTLKMDDIKICYIMSDFTLNNIHYYETHPALQPFLDKGILDFAIFDMETERPITLIKKGLILSPEIVINPLIVFGNYIFDTVSHDAFSVRDGKLHELLLSISTPQQNIKNNKPISMDQLQTDYTLQEIHSTYYEDDALNNLLAYYQDNLKNSSFLLPIGSIRAINLLKKLSNNNLFIVASDKGYNTLAALENLGHPTLSFHGSFSMMVNFHALANYFESTGGDAFLQTPRKGIKTSVFVSNTTFNTLPNTRLAIANYVEEFSPADYFTLHRRLSDSFQECSLDTLAAHLNFSRWDPHIYLKISNRINILLGNADQDTVTYLANNLHKIAANYYSMPKADCVLFEIAVFFHTLKKYDEALNYYKAAEPFVGEQFSLYYNLALCEQHLGFIEKALDHFKKALTLDSSSKEAIEWISFMEQALENQRVEK